MTSPLPTHPHPDFFAAGIPVFGPVWLAYDLLVAGHPKVAHGVQHVLGMLPSCGDAMAVLPSWLPSMTPEHYGYCDEPWVRETHDADREPWR